MLKGLVASLSDAETASDVGAVLLTGAGGAFCAGGDVKGIAEAGVKEAMARSNTTLESTCNDEINETQPASYTNCLNQLLRCSRSGCGCRFVDSSVVRSEIRATQCNYDHGVCSVDSVVTTVEPTL